MCDPREKPYYYDIVNMVKESYHPLSVRQIASRIGCTRKYTAFVLETAKKHFDKNITKVLKTPHNARRKRPVWSYNART